MELAAGIRKEVQVAIITDTLALRICGQVEAENKAIQDEDVS